MEDIERKRVKSLIRLGLVIGAIAFFGVIGFASILSIFINSMEAHWGLLILSIVCFSISAGAVYVLVNYHDILVEKKEAEEKGYKSALEEEIEKQYDSKLDSLMTTIEAESARTRSLINDMHYYGGYR